MVRGAVWHMSFRKKSKGGDKLINTFLKAINHFCKFILSYFIERFTFLIDFTSYIVLPWIGMQ